MRQSLEVQKNNLKNREEQSNRQIYFVFFICLLHISFNIFINAVKIMTAESYYFNQRYFKNDTQNHIRLTNLANIQYICFGILGPFGTLIVQKMIVRMKFRVILFLGALGSCVFLMIPLQTSLCAQLINQCQSQPSYIECNQDKNQQACDLYDNCSQHWYCSIPLIFSNGVLFSLISGIAQSIYFFAILFYITNITKKEDKAIYFATFFFLHNFCCMIGGGVGFLIMDQEDYCYPHYFEICFVVSGFLSFIFLVTPEGGQDLRLPQFQRQLQIVIKKSLEANSKEENQLKQMLMKQQFEDSDSDENDDEKIEFGKEIKREVVLKKQKTKSQSTSSIPLMFFSIEQEDLESLYNKDESARNYEQKSFFVNLLETLQKINQQHFIYVIPQILIISFIQSFTFLYLYYYVNVHIDTEYQKYSDTSTLLAFIYLGIGQMFGTFSLGVVGDLNDKLRTIVIFLLLLLIPCIIGLLSYRDIQVIYTYYIFCIVLGFCESGLQVLVLTLIIYEFNCIYIFELVYTIYSLGIAFWSGLLVLGNYYAFQISIIFLTCFVVINLLFVGRYLVVLSRSR